MVYWRIYALDLVSLRFLLRIISNNDIDDEPLSGGAPRSMEFTKYRNKNRKLRAIAMGVFGEILKRPAVTDSPGYIYILQIPQHSDYVKIGRTSRGPEERLKEQMKCGVELDLLDEDSRCYVEVEYHMKIEQLIKADLWNERQKLQCTCNTEHGEYYKVDKEKALAMVETWKDWTRCEPYEDGSLKDVWKKRVNYLKRDKDFTQTLEKEESVGKRWESFITIEAVTPYSLIRSWMWDKRLDPSGKLCPSRVDAFCMGWKSFVIFCFVHYVGTCLLSWSHGRWIGGVLTLLSTIFAI